MPGDTSNKHFDVTLAELRHLMEHRGHDAIEKVIIISIVLDLDFIIFW